MDDFEQDWADMMAGNYTYDEIANNVDTGYYTYNDAAFDQDWNDVISGKYTFDEVASGDDIKSEAEMLQWASKSAPGLVSSLVKSLGSSAGSFLKKYLYNPDTNTFNLAGLTTAAMGLYDMFGKKGDGGYNRPVPKMELVRQQIQYDDANRRPGEAGRQYFTDAQYIPRGDEAARTQALSNATTQAQGIRSLAPTYQAKTNPYVGTMNLAALRPASPAAASSVTEKADSIPQIPQPTGFNNMASGGIAGLKKDGRYLDGPTDGMADEIDTSIDDEQPAKLSHGEFVIPADVVSHLGNGNSEAGAKKLYEMMDRVRMARTGTKEQGKEINPDEFTMGGLANLYASGGAVKRFNGTTGSAVTSTSTANSGLPPDTSRMSTLSPWVGDYVTDALGRGEALATQPYQAYTGPLTAGPSDLQQQAFAGASDIAKTGYTPGQFNAGTFNTQAVQQYMNPYLDAALQPQLAELNRQAQMKRMEDAARLTKAGAFGGGRQAVMESEGNRNLLDLQRKALGEGYATAYDKAVAQFNAQQNREMEAQKAAEESRQFGAGFGLKSLDALSGLGKTQRDIEAEGIAADKAQFEEARDWAYKMPEYQMKLLSNLPISASTTSVDQSGIAGLMTKISSLLGGYKQLEEALKDLGQTPSTPATNTTTTP